MIGTQNTTLLTPSHFKSWRITSRMNFSLSIPTENAHKKISLPTVIRIIAITKGLSFFN